MVQSILIVGGGSSGWITANLLNTYVKRSGRDIRITLVESPDIPTIGVGEATVPSIRRTFNTIGIGEADIMNASEASFKTLIRFINWQGTNDAYDHPFDRREKPKTDAAAYNWAASNGMDFDRSFSVLSQIAEDHLAPKTAQTPQYLANFPYAYHLDAIKMAHRLAEFGKERGINHTLGLINKVNISPEGMITSVETDRGDTLEADLFVDCSGFRSLLLGEAMGVGKRHFSDKLLCDSAVTMRVPYDVHKPDHLLNYTKATAQDAGWIWDINLQSRRGVGYVYSSAFQSKDQAEARLRAYEGAHSDDIDVRHIPFTSSKRTVSWKNNCVAIGLSDGFLEPLESSGLYLIEIGAMALGIMLEDYIHSPQAAINHFNTITSDLFDEILSFVNLHYVISKRRDTPFWQAATAPEAIVDDLKDRIEIWKQRSPIPLDFMNAQRLFGQDSFEFILHGMKWTDRPLRQTPQKPDLSMLSNRARKEFPPHAAYLSAQKSQRS